ncbi:thyroid hormone receptor beta-like isoform X1 [Centruroides vittatus]|uniref:thyroid hormone receptor beta-like isoform X1 n=2 Tax=Centruroides sculpturatus TaxID=218467 RepID=UPI000C6EFD7F|nr:thyroid hormone receptor beta-like isoform X1 [Centruroides sculpturatus]
MTLCPWYLHMVYVPWCWSILPSPGMSVPPNGNNSAANVEDQCSRGSGKPPKVCGVCGDRAKSYHFGGISCDSCKAFFRRSVQNEAYKNFHCPYEGKCEITISSRKCCQYCRFQKCVSIGMEKGWVMTEEERMQLLRSRMEKRQRQEAAAAEGDRMRQRRLSIVEYEPDVNELSKYLSEDDVRTIEILVNSYEMSYRDISFSDQLQNRSIERTRTEILDMFFTVIKQFAHFAQRLDSFSKIPQAEQEVLLRTGVLELCFIRGAYAYDERHCCWPDKRKSLYRDSPILVFEDMKKLVSPTLYEKHMKFIYSVKELEPDEPTIMLLLVIVLLSPDRQGLDKVDVVASEQERFYILMKSYMNWRYGPENTTILYPKLLLRLPDLRELADAHTDYHLRLAKEELEEIQQRLSSLKIVSSASNQSIESLPMTSSSLEVSSVFHRPWCMRKDALQIVGPISPLSPEEESSSSEGSERFTPIRS